MRRLTVGLAVLALVATGCSAGGGGDETASPLPSASIDTTPVTLEFWSDFSPNSDTEDQLVHVFDMVHEEYPWITIEPVGNQDDQKIVNAINAGEPPDIALSFSPDNIGKLCSTGAFQDLGPYIERDQLDMSQFPAAADTYTQYQGVRCALPMLADAYGLYYNQDLLAKAGIAEPPKTFSELTADAKELTEFNADGSIKVAGYLPWLGFYGEWGPGSFAQSLQAQWFDEAGNSIVNQDPQWPYGFEWQQELIDFYGRDNIIDFVASVGDEWSPDMAFQSGEVAMMFDGEWRVDSIRDAVGDKLNYGTAAFPVADNMADTYGSGTIGGNLLGIPDGAPNAEASWLAIQFMATDTDALVYLVNNFKNLPTTTASLESPDLTLDPHFEPFFAIYGHPDSSFPPITGSGSAYLDLMGNFMEQWQDGKVDDLQAGLDEVAKQIDEQSQLEAGP